MLQGTCPERFARNKQSILLGPFVSYEQNEVLWIWLQRPIKLLLRGATTLNTTTLSIKILSATLKRYWASMILSITVCTELSYAEDHYAVGCILFLCLLQHRTYLNLSKTYKRCRDIRSNDISPNEALKTAVGIVGWQCSTKLLFYCFGEYKMWLCWMSSS